MPFEYQDQALVTAETVGEVIGLDTANETAKDPRSCINMEIQLQSQQSPTMTVDKYGLVKDRSYILKHSWNSYRAHTLEQKPLVHRHGPRNDCK